MSKKYTMSKKRRKRDTKQMKLDKRIDILMKRNQGWTFQRIADVYGQSRQSILDIYNKIRNVSVQDLEDLRKEIESE